METNMNRFTTPMSAFFVLGLLGLGCASGGGNPVTPDAGPVPAVQTQEQLEAGSRTHLWGYYDVYLDIEAQEATVVPNRNAMFAINVVFFLNGTPSNLSFNFNGTTPGPGYVDVDLDVSITHPIAGKPQFNGYDVRGVFIGDGSGVMAYDSDLTYAVPGVDQYMLDDPINGDGGGPDGYTRWYNPDEFPVSGLFGYMDGVYATNIPNPATLNPYKYFTDGLTSHQDLWEFQNFSPNLGVFSTGVENTRNYYIRFPVPNPGIQYGYAIVASWEGAAIHPANAIETTITNITVTDDIYYTPTTSGGDLILDIGVWEWEDQPSVIQVESTVLSAPYVFSASDMIPVGGGDLWASYHVEIPADNVTTTTGNEFWLIYEFPGWDYTCTNTPPGGAPTDTLAAFFRNDLLVADHPYGGNDPPVILSGVDGPSEVAPDAVSDFTVVATDPDLDALTYSWTVTDTSTVTVVFSGPGDGLGEFQVDWAGDVGASDGDVYEIDCLVGDSINPDVPADTLTVTCSDTPATTLYLYDGTVDDGGITVWDDGFGFTTWQYCPGVEAWDENECNPYFIDNYALAYTPFIQFPDPGSFTTIHLEIWHWGDMQDDEACYGSLGTLEDEGGGSFDWAPNWDTEALVYLEGFDFNDPPWADWSFVYGSEGTPEWSHFDCSAYAGNEYAVGFQFEEYGVANPLNQEGWNIRKLWIWYD